jgi:small-conductance mechanosensitive channel
MKDSVKNILKLILGLTIILLAGAAIFLIVLNAGWFNALPLVLRNSVVFGVIVFSAAVIFIIPKTHLFYGALRDSFKRDAIKFEKWDERNKKDIESLSIDKSKYKNITKIYSQLNRIKGLFFILPSSFFLIFFTFRSEQFNIVITFFLITTAVLVIIIMDG